MKKLLLILALLIALPAPARASAILESANSEWFSTETVPVTAVPFFIVAWFKTADTSTTTAIVSLLDKDATGFLGARFVAAGSIANDPVRAQAGSHSADTTTGYSADTWTHAAGFWKSGTDRRAYINGRDSGSQGSSITLADIDRLGIGAFADSTPSAFFNGRIAHVAVYDATGLSDEHVELAIANLAGEPSPAAGTYVFGHNPLTVLSAALIAYWPLLTDAKDAKGSNTLTANGTISFDSDNPLVAPLIWPDEGGPVGRKR